MRCGDVMSQRPLTCREITSISECARLMRDHRVGFLVVVDAASHPLGVVTDRDLVIRAVANEKTPRLPVGEVMTRPPLLLCHQEDELHQLERRMGETGLSRALVVDRYGKLLGVITLTDIVRAEPSALRAARLSRDVAHPTHG